MISTRFALAALAGATALSITACGSSNTSSPASSAPASSTHPSSAVASPTSQPSTPPSAPPKGEAQVRGLIASVANNGVQVTQQNGTATVDFTASTKVTEVTTAALTDVSAGSCISVRSKDQGGQPVTAASVRVSPAVDGKCPEGKEPAPNTPVRGTVASVAGNTITINTSGAPQTVTVTDKTRYAKEAPTNSQAIAQGKCIAARGSETGGALQATTISLRTATNGKCFEGGGPHRR